MEKHIKNKALSIIFNKTIFLLCLLQVITPESVLAAKSVGAGVSQEVESGLRGAGVSEYYFRNDSDDILVPVYLIGAVNKPGLYHVPIKSDLVNLLAISGGTTSDAELDSVQIRNRQTNQIKEIDFVKMIASSTSVAPSLTGNEVVFIPTKTPTFSTNTVSVIGVISGLLGIAMATVVITRGK